MKTKLKKGRVLKSSCYLKLEPRYSPSGDPVGFRITGISTRLPKKGHCINVAVSIPVTAFAPYVADIEVPEHSVNCIINVEEGESDA